MKNPKSQIPNPNQYPNPKSKKYWSLVLSHRSFRKGFTVMEMIVTMGIMVMLTLLYVANFKGFQQRLIVESDADAISSSIRQLQLWALSGELIGAIRPAGGYGLTAPAPCTNGTCTYTLFGDTCNPASHRYDSGCDTIVATKNLNAQVSITGSSPSSPLDIVIIFPAAISYVNGNTSQNGSITLTHRSDPAKTKTVAFDGVSGQITIQ